MCLLSFDQIPSAGSPFKASLLCEEMPKGPLFPFYFISLVSPFYSPFYPSKPPKIPFNFLPYPLFSLLPPLFLYRSPSPALKSIKGAKNPLSDLILRPSPFPLTTSPHVPRRQDQVLKSPVLIAIGRSAGVLFLCNIKSPDRDRFNTLCPTSANRIAPRQSQSQHSWCTP